MRRVFLIIMLLSLLLVPLLVNAITSTIQIDNVNWEKPNSKVWPAIRGRDPTHVQNALGIWSSDEWDYSIDVPDGSHYDEIVHMIEMAMDRLSNCLEAFIHHPSELPINPTNASLFPKTGVQILLETTHVTLCDADESYSIDINDIADWIEIKAKTLYGALHGITTLQQLLQFGWIVPETLEPIFTIPILSETLVDIPAYPYRGLMIDTARHFLPLSLIEYTIEIMAANKMNVLHWHMTDSQSWPYLGKRYPELANAAYCKACVYTQEDIRRIQMVAQTQGIRVIPEFDLPGHSEAIAKSHPEVMTHCRGEFHEPLDPTKETVYEFVKNLFGELFDVFDDPWIHVGGDEVWTDCWENSTEIQEWMRSHNMTDAKELLWYYENRHIAMIEDHRRPIVWQDIYDVGVRLAQHVVHDVWKLWVFDETLFNVTKDGYDVVISACWYLDDLSRDWWKFYQCNPRDIVNATAQQRHHVLGGHASMWGENVDATDFLERVWPRTSAVAEVLWSGSPTYNHSSPLKVNDIQDRLADFRCWLVRRYALPASPIRPGYCGYGPVSVAK